MNKVIYRNHLKSFLRPLPSFLIRIYGIMILLFVLPWLPLVVSIFVSESAKTLYKEVFDDVIKLLTYDFV